LLLYGGDIVDGRRGKDFFNIKQVRKPRFRKSRVCTSATQERVKGEVGTPILDVLIKGASGPVDFETLVAIAHTLLYLQAPLGKKKRCMLLANVNQLVK
jgi:hypothetical protein